MNKLKSENLLALARLLFSIPEESKSQFDMYNYMVKQGEVTFGSAFTPTQAVEHTCGTAACAIGHAPRLGLCPPNPDESWYAYSLRFTFKSEPLSSDIDHCSDEDVLWDWMFSAEWSAWDNTPQGAAKRIMVALNRPQDAIEFMRPVVEDFDGTLDVDKYLEIISHE